jgi:hypothetical protein
MQQLRQRLVDLRLSVAKLYAKSIMPMTSRSITVSDKMAPAPVVSTLENDAKLRAEYEQPENVVRGSLDLVRLQRAELEGSGNQEKSDVQRSLELNVIAKVKELEDEVESTLLIPLDERAAKLHVLQERLKISSRWGIETSDKQDRTPTISTIVRHRNE